MMDVYAEYDRASHDKTRVRPTIVVSLILPRCHRTNETIMPMRLATMSTQDASASTYDP